MHKLGRVFVIQNIPLRLVLDINSKGRGVQEGADIECGLGSLQILALMDSLNHPILVEVKDYDLPLVDIYHKEFLVDHTPELQEDSGEGDYVLLSARVVGAEEPEGGGLIAEIKLDDDEAVVEEELDPVDQRGRGGEGHGPSLLE